jgi:hypothetical protein
MWLLIDANVHNADVVRGTAGADSERWRRRRRRRRRWWWSTQVLKLRQHGWSHVFFLDNNDLGLVGTVDAVPERRWANALVV